MDDQVDLDREAQQHFVPYLERMIGAWQITNSGAQVQALTAGNEAVSFTVVGSRTNTWRVRRDTVVGAEPQTLNGWWAFVLMPAGGTWESLVFLVPEPSAKRVIIRLIGKDYFAQERREPSTLKVGSIDVPLLELLPNVKGFDALPA